MGNGAAIAGATLCVILLAVPFHETAATESEAVAKTGLRSLQLVTPARDIAPGETITMGLLLDPEPGFHTYWRGPGVVGVPTRIDWILPEGFKAGPLLWPTPETVKMAALTAHGYAKRVCLLTEITAPDSLAGDASTFVARCSWMACATTCHPGNTELSLTLSHRRRGDGVSEEAKWRDLVDATRARLPRAMPAGWEIEATRSGESAIELAVKPGTTLPSLAGIRFFSHDLQVHSDEPQVITPLEGGTGGFRMVLIRPEFAPDAPSALTGVLVRRGGWPGVEAEGIEITVQWEAAGPDQERR